MNLKKQLLPEIEVERLKKMKQKERILLDEVSRKTQELQIEKIRAESANIAKSKFLGAMSHELITPLNGIIGLCEVLQLQATDESSESFLGGIKSSGEDMLELVKQILSYSDTAITSHETKNERFAPLKVINESIKTNTELAIKRNISVSEVVAHKILPEVFSDFFYVKEILLIFLSNAVKYIPENGVIEVGADYDGEEQKINFFVSDNGSGIAPQNQELPFNAFERLNHQNGNISGAGVGLAIAKMMVEQIGGKIGYETNEIGGARFWISLSLTS